MREFESDTRMAESDTQTNKSFINIEDLEVIMETKRIEKIEVKKSSGIFFYTGTLTVIDEIFCEIITTRGETLRFRHEQIESRRPVEETKGNDNGKNKSF